MKERFDRREPVTMAVRPAPSTPCVTSSAVERDENPDAPFLPQNHIFEGNENSVTVLIYFNDQNEKKKVMRSIHARMWRRENRDLYKVSTNYVKSFYFKQITLKV